jgi:D-alanyl-lipoteichoic acid acyltransferase DltB (MBOAT superfamily)
MLFNTLTFFIFFILFLIFYLPVRRQAKPATIVIIIFSSVFYGWWDWRFLPLMWATMIVDFYLGYRLSLTEDAKTRKRIVLISLVSNLGMLAFFKYTNFFIRSFVWDTTLADKLVITNLVLPIGISFYTFQSMSYVLDVYRKDMEPVKSLREFCSFVTFFPQLVAGPIERAGHLLPQILKPDTITGARVLSGLFVFASGLLRKTMGDAVSLFHDPIFQDVASAAPAMIVMAIFSFGLQIYLDFSGYSEMAMGLGRVIGIEFMHNFKAPYLSNSIREFWHRWHISLSTWLRDYLYISLGGNRIGLAKQIRNLLCTFALCGLWHGAGWTFVIWGLLHGIYLTINTTFDVFLGNSVSKKPVIQKILAIVGFLLTFLAANYAWLYFRLPTLELTIVANQKIMAWLLNPSLPQVPYYILGIAVITLLFDLRLRVKGELLPVEPELNLAKTVAFGLLTVVIFFVSVIYSIGQPTQQFIYFQF